MRPVPAPVGSALASENNTKYLNIKVKELHCKDNRQKLFQLPKQVSDKHSLPFLGTFLLGPILWFTSSNRSSSSFFFSAICSSFDLPGNFLSVNLNTNAQY